MNSDALISRIAEEVRIRLSGEASGHDWWHVHRVWRLAQQIGGAEDADMVIVELAALLHDIADWKFHGGDETVGPRVARELLTAHAVPARIIDAVCAVIPEISFTGADVASIPSTLEGMIVQDADRLDALGAIGIARTFAYGGHRGQPMHDPDVPPVRHDSKEAYVASRSSTINHFYEKLLLLDERMNTAAARHLAADRRRFMEDFLNRFFLEWRGEV